MGNTTGKVESNENSRGIKQIKRRTAQPSTPSMIQNDSRRVIPQRNIYRGDMVMNERELYPQRRLNMNEMDSREMMYS